MYFGMQNSQVSLGEVKNMKSANSILVRMTVDEKEMVIGTLSVDKAPQIMFDLVLEKDFTLSHGWKDGSLYFCGYTAAADQGYPSLCPLVFCFHFLGLISLFSPFLLNCCEVFSRTLSHGPHGNVLFYIIVIHRLKVCLQRCSLFIFVDYSKTCPRLSFYIYKLSEVFYIYQVFP